MLQALKLSRYLTLPEAKFYVKLILLSISLNTNFIEGSRYKITSSLYSWSSKALERVNRYLENLRSVEFVSLRGRGILLQVENLENNKIRVSLPQNIIEMFKEVNCESNFIKILTGGKVW